MRIAFQTLGCKVNTYETEALQRLFTKRGFIIVDSSERADIYVINTCTVTNRADAKSRKAIRQAIKRNPEGIICAIGCYTQVNPDAVTAISGVDIILGTSERETLPDLIKTYRKTRAPLKHIRDIQQFKSFDRLNVTSFKEQTRAFIKIQDGCNQYCSFCIIPYARGPIRSRAPIEIIKEAKTLIKKGYQEIVLTGIHTGGYGQDLTTTSFYDLLKTLSQLKGLRRLRISSIEMNQLSDDVLDLMAKNEIFARHVHIPLQSGCDATLKRMSRRYNVQEYREKIKHIRSKLPDVAITTDIIVGFPKETEEDFIETINNVKAFDFMGLHVFPYSKRHGTKAAEMDHHVSDAVKTDRAKRLLKISEAMHLAYAQRYQNVLQEVLIERCKDGWCYGHTDNYLQVRIPTTTGCTNQFMKVKIQEASCLVSHAEIVEE